MSSPLIVSEIIERNNELAKSWTPWPLFSEIAAFGMASPSILITTCADPRLNPVDFLGLKPGELVVTVRNVNGHIAPNLNDILALDVLLGFKEILIVHHTDCGATHFKEDQVKGILSERAPGNKEVAFMQFGAIGDVPLSVRDDIAILKASPLVRKELLENVHGYVLDIKTGKLSPV
ncbi:carbonic anhydrase [Tothia fuscella]|uniref:Carbonic anhydrase n=1 Tax=Tothia fuscella TaxID=1048955 RepID=A0A9P4NQW8_9PEZI|nr:carbonic anhydrase [Tothia fuscella]